MCQYTGGIYDNKNICQGYSVISDGDRHEEGRVMNKMEENKANHGPYSCFQEI